MKNNVYLLYYNKCSAMITLIPAKVGEYMKRFATVFLRIAIVFMGAGVLALCIFLLPTLWGEVAIEFPSYAYAVYAVFVAMYLTALPFVAALLGAWRLLDCIDNGMAFTKQAAHSVASIAFAAGLVSLIYVISLPFFYVWAENDDAPGLVVIGMVLVMAPMVIAVFAFLLHHLIAEAATIKSENELTV